MDRYEDFLEFCRKIDEAELGRIILKEKVQQPDVPEKTPEDEKKPDTENTPGPGQKPEEK